jgi:anti-sigma factor RsiW
MHGVVIQDLEEYLAGTLGPAARRAVDSHLGACQVCRQEVAGMRDVSLLFGSLQAGQDLALGPGFYAGVMRRVDARKPVPPFAGLFNLNLAFGRRLVLTSLMTLAVLGSYLLARELRYPEGPSPEAVMAQESSPALETASAQDQMLVTLAAYEH